MKTTVLALAAVCLAAGFASAHTIEGGDSATVRYSELDLTRPQGAKVLVGRIKQAARTVCGPRPSLFALADYDRYVACSRQATGAAVERLDAPVVTAVYKGADRQLVFSRR